MQGNHGKPPFRADHVGSLLRPADLLEARAKKQRGEITAAELKEAEDGAIRKAVALQEDIGLQAITDGEFRRTYFHVDFLEKLEGVTVSGGMAVKFRSKEGDLEFAPPRLEVSGKLRRPVGIVTEDLAFLQSATSRLPKVCIPSPTMLHFRGGRQAVDKTASALPPSLASCGFPPRVPPIESAVMLASKSTLTVVSNNPPSIRKP